MKNKIKKVNPAFKLRQVLPQLPGLTGRAGSGAKEITKMAAANPAAGTPPVIVTTE